MIEISSSIDNVVLNSSSRHMQEMLVVVAMEHSVKYLCINEEAIEVKRSSGMHLEGKLVTL